MALEERRALVVEALGETTEEVNGECAIGDGLAQLDEGVGEGFHAPTIVDDGEGALTYSR